jgi:molybdopterin synthase catalytic subunit
MAGGAAVGAMALEHYPGMTEKKVAETEAVLEPRGDRRRSPMGRGARQRR